MIPRGVEIFVALDPIDLRYGFDRLCGVVTERLGRSARAGALFVFFGRRRTAVKVLFCDRTGVCVFYKRLDAHTFRIPEPAIEGDVARLIDENAFDDLIDGLEIEPTSRSRRRRVH
jgi:transposase